MYGGLFQAAPCFSRSSLYMPTHKCSQCLNTGISRAESDSGSLHIFIWEISVPLTEWNCLRIKLSKYMKIIYENCGVKNYMKEDHRSCRRNFCSWEKKAFCSCVCKTTKTVRALWLAERSVCIMRVCKHGCGVKVFCFSRAKSHKHEFEKVFKFKTRQVYFIYSFLRRLKLGKSLQRRCQFFFA